MTTKADLIRSTFAAAAEAVVAALGETSVPLPPAPPTAPPTPPVPPVPPVTPPAPPVPPVPPVIPPPSGIVRAVVTLACDPALPNKPFDVRVTVIGTNPTGTVSVDDSNQAAQKAKGTLIGTGNQKVIVFSVTLPEGRYMLQPRYSGDAANLADIGDGVPVNVGVTVIVPTPPVEPPSVEGELLFAPNLRSRADIEANFVGVSGIATSWGNPDPHPNIDSIQYIPLDSEGFPGVTAARVWAAVGLNEKLVAWHKPFEPKVRAFGDGCEHLVLEYLLRIGEDVGAGMAATGCKLPGFSGLYDLDALGVELPNPRISPFGVWECRMFHGPITALGYRLACYAYLTRDPRNGSSASVGKYWGNGNPNGNLLTNAYLIPGKLHRIRQEIRLNTVKNKALINPATAGADQMQELIDNCNLDGLLRISLDGKVVGEWTTVGYRGLDRARIYGLFVNIYQGGHGIYPRSPEHYDLADIRITVRKPAGTAPVPPVIPPVPPVIPPIPPVPPVTPPATGGLSTLLPGFARKLATWVSTAYPGAGALFKIDYSGITFDAARNRVLFGPGGGHGMGQTTDILALDMATLAWSSLYPSIPHSDMTAANLDPVEGRWKVPAIASAGMPAKHPLARHTYQVARVLGDRYYCLQPWDTGTYNVTPIPPPASDPHCYSYGFVTNDFIWSAIKTPWGYGSCAVVAGSKFLVLGTDIQSSGSVSIWLYDPTPGAESVTVLASLGAHQSGPGVPGTWNIVYFPPTGKYIINMSDGKAWEFAYNAANPTASVATAVVYTGTSPLTSAPNYAALDYDPAHQRIGMLRNGTYYALDPVAKVWASEAVTLEAGSTGIPTLGFNACCFAGSCIIALDFDGITWAYRPKV